MMPFISPYYYTRHEDSLLSRCLGDPDPQISPTSRGIAIPWILSAGILVNYLYSFTNFLIPLASH